MNLAHFKDVLSTVYYVIGAISLVLAFVRIIYGWFRDFDNANRFTADMALVHLPYIYKSQQQIAQALGIELDSPPVVSFSKDQA